MGLWFGGSLGCRGFEASVEAVFWRGGYGLGQLRVWRVRALL